MIGDTWTAGLFRQYAPGHPHGCILNNPCEVERLGPLLRERGGLAVSDDPNDVDESVMLFGTPDARRESIEVEYSSLLGKKRTETLHIAFLGGSAAK